MEDLAQWVRALGSECVRTCCCRCGVDEEEDEEGGQEKAEEEGGEEEEAMEMQAFPSAKSRSASSLPSAAVAV